MRIRLNDLIARFLCIAAALTSFVAWRSAAGQASDAGALSNVSNTWLDSFHLDADRQIELLVAAYGLNAQQQAALRQEMDIRLAKQKAFEDKEMVELGTLADSAAAAGDDSPEAKAALAKLDYIAKNMPFSEDQVANWVDQEVGPKAAAEGHMRWEELRQRQDAAKEASESDIIADANIKKQFAITREVNEARVLPETEQPVPGGEKGERIWPAAAMSRDRQARVAPPVVALDPETLTAKYHKPVKSGIVYGVEPPPAEDNSGEAIDGAMGADAPPASTVAIPEPALPPPAPMPTLPEVKPVIVGATPAPLAPPLPAAPPLDDWDKYVISLAEKYRFNEAQMTNAKSILRDLKRRAHGYRMSRADEFAKAIIMTDARVREDRIKNLNRPLDALFEELKQRLEALPTLEQKQRAGGSGAKSAK